ncbi:putative alcohol dehydrogenase [Phaeobacter inhibens]|uniref:Alcohol dehydrogenase n=1 Tax=Phaeobacter inhibens TaxID=221822 RepID=A0ABM6RAA9_9RHOB|nr:NADP-dependent oxidoreductase [Phaeobacter inhibens]AUQ48787.1 putative alcohol dehydrogenase [Phaeobacter inhibens]AUQ93287.1 putative alcohol dehydrogenase [Phaeobacter inhibens]AUR18590.1 putative alcohol dehydrogenase [Phaeobacter inhibens]UWR91694.1 NADP-dependent oxidoreductase [Phaeobacter inhibens]
MKAAIIETFGDVNVFRMTELPRPDPKSGELLIRIHASSVNPVDVGVRSGQILPNDTAHFPMVLGWDAAGTVEALGSETVGFAPGDRVMAISPQPGSLVGTHAQFAALPASQVVKIADALPITTAAAVPLIGSTALAALQALDLAPGARILINNPKGAVGAIAAKIAPLLGFELAPPDALGVDGAIDVRGCQHAQKAFAAVKDGGAYVTIVPEWWKPGGVFTSARGITPVTVQNPANQDLLAPLADWLAQGDLIPEVEEILPLDQISEAHRRLETPGLTGKLVLDHAIF